LRRIGGSIAQVGAGSLGMACGILRRVSQENLDLVRSIYQRWNAKESTSDLIHPQLEYVNPSYAVESGVRHSRATLGKIREVYPDFRVETERFVDAGDEVVVVGVVHATSASGVEVKWRQGYVWTIRDGLAVRFCWFNDPAEALRAVGVE
jgi:ketosteroid isomerase-like protein